jgi:hypothetical protein
VFGRTNGITHQYYYPRFEGGYWTPWEKISLNIEGDFLLPVVWKKQLYVLHHRSRVISIAEKREDFAALR